MANKEQRGNREKRKPKKEKPKLPAQASSFSQATSAPKTGKKGSLVTAACILVLVAPQHRPNASNDQTHRERLGDVIVGAHVEIREHICVRGQKYHRHIG